MTNSRRIGFDDTSIKGGFSDRPKGWSGESGTTYRLRLITDPQAFYSAMVETHDKNGHKTRFQTPSLAAYDDCEAAAKGDRSALARCKEACPLWAADFKMKKRFACMILLIQEEDSKRRVKTLNQIWPWGFAGERYEQLRNILFSNQIINSPGHPYDGKNLPLHLIELSINVTDSDFQKMNIIPLKSKGEMAGTWATHWEMVKDFFADQDPMTGRDSACSLLEDFIAPESFIDLVASLDRAKKGPAGEQAQDTIGGDRVQNQPEIQVPAPVAPRSQAVVAPGRAAAVPPQRAGATASPGAGSPARAPSAAAPAARTATPASTTRAAPSTPRTSPSNPAPSPEAAASQTVEDLLEGVDDIDLG